MKLLANENFPYKSIYYLKTKGYDIISIGMDNPGIKDAEIMELLLVKKEQFWHLTEIMENWYSGTIINLKKE